MKQLTALRRKQVLALAVMAALVAVTFWPDPAEPAFAFSEENYKEDKYGNYINIRAHFGGAVRVEAEGGNFAVNIGIGKGGASGGKEIKLHYFGVRDMRITITVYRNNKAILSETFTEDYKGSCPGRTVEYYDIPDCDKIRVSVRASFICAYPSPNRNPWIFVPLIKTKTASLTCKLVAP